jgi:CTP synthase
LYIHLTLVPYLKAAKELKTKPTQHSVGQLRQIGIQPDILICRTEHSLSRDDREKIALFCNISIDAVIEEKDKDFSIYEVPLSLVDNKLDKLIVDQLGLKTVEPDLEDWRELLQRLRHPNHEISIAVVGKYAEHHDAYKSIYESLDHAGIAHRAQIRIGKIQSEDIETEGPERLLSGYDGILVPGGFGERGIEGKVTAIRYARTKGIPFLGLCLGMQCAVIEFGRNVCNLVGAHSTEFDKNSPHPVICLLDAQKTITDKGGTMRLGAQPTKLEPGSVAATCYGKTEVSERHRHRYEFNNRYRDQFIAHGMKFSGTSPDGSLVEIVELPKHPWFLAVQYHPEFKSKPTAPQALFAGFVEAAIERNKGRGERSASPKKASGKEEKSPVAVEHPK